MSDEINYAVMAALRTPKPEGEGTGPAFVCECGQRTRVEAMDTPLNTVRCIGCGRMAAAIPAGAWDFTPN